MKSVYYAEVHELQRVKRSWWWAGFIYGSLVTVLLFAAGFLAGSLFGG